MALEPGEVTGIVNAVQAVMDPIIEQLEQRVRAVELRVANLEPRVNGTQMQREVEGGGGLDEETITRIEEIEGLVVQLGQAAHTHEQYIAAHEDVLRQHALGLIRVLAGDASGDAWKEYVTREAVRVGVGVKEYAEAARKGRQGQAQTPLQEAARAMAEAEGEGGGA